MKHLNIKTFEHLKNPWLILTLIAIVLLFVLTYWNVPNMPFERDEGEYAYSAWLMDQGLIPYENSFLQKPPAIVYTYWLAHKISPFTVWPARLLMIIFSALTTWLLYLIVKKITNRKTALLAAAISIPVMAIPHLTALAANTEKFMLLPLTGLFALYIYFKNSSLNWPYYLAGLSGAGAVLYKPIATLPVFLILIIWLINYWRQRYNWKKIIMKTGQLIVGGLGLTFISLLPFFITNTFNQLWQQVVKFNSYYAADFVKYWPEMFLQYGERMLNNWWLLIILALTTIFLKTKHRWLLLTLLIISLISIINSPIGHYYLLITPWLIILAALAIANIWQLIFKKIKNPDWQRVITVSTFVIVLASIIWPLTQQYFLNPDQLSIWIYGTQNPFVESTIIADKVKMHSQANDKIFVAGSEPQIYYYSQRLSASRFNITYPLIIDTPLREKYQKQAMDDLTDNKPVLIVYSQRAESGLWNEETPRFFIDNLNQLLSNQYELIGGTAWTKQGPTWLEPIHNQEELNAASLLLFKKKL